MTNYTPRQSQPKRKGRPLLPVIGLLLAVCFAAIAYVIAPPLVDLLTEQSPKIGTQFAQLRRDYGENSVEYIFTGLVWLLLLGLSSFIVALFVGKDPAKETFDMMGPHPRDTKAVAKAQRKAQKEAKQRLKKREAQRKKEDRPY
ncbi:MAG TPA: hypothetical protein PKD09_22170 [Aggregatilinea sp.]|jgi:hypothetical protein|uniref:hypothetical protein n=1 Tax=Aggregatilinea sp. TaxID=2806333 RepID=UPI002C12F9BA|nr:hypothetical protein [Aggregatilinea sp.]HML24378.1 hypothetical protein [Aggregatilinea sp.]